jgi:TolB protein
MHPSRTLVLVVAVAATACSTSPEPLAPDQEPAALAAAQKGKPSKIAFTVDPAGNSGLFLVKADGSGLKTLLDRPAADQQAAYSPDGRLIAFASDQSGARQIYTAKADGRNPAAVTGFTDGSWVLDPAWSPDGSRIAFTRIVAGNTDVYVIGADGTGLARLTDDLAVDHHPAWSPDGATIAFSTTRDGNGEVYTMSADGSNQTAFTACLLHCFSPAWAPGGHALAYQRGSDLVIQPLAGGTPVQAAQNLDQFAKPAWSRDGSELVFVGVDAAAQRDLFVVKPDGTGLRRLTNTPALEAWPSWGP